MCTPRQGWSTSRSSSLLTMVSAPAARASCRYLSSLGSRQSVTGTAGSNHTAVRRRISDALSTRERNRERELGAPQNSGNLGIDWGRKSEYIDFFGTQQSALRDAVRLERRAYQG